ncbi:MAG: hypothetical protein LIP01_13760 [Tannerellaceae bacterium]|nr:hypothetical protein [Tannerellaceae bacterium]
MLKKEPENPLALSYKGTFLAFKIALFKVRAVTLGPQSMRYINKAYKLDPSDTQIMADKANLLYYSPSIIGGNKEAAIALYQQAIREMKRTNQDSGNWFYLSLHTTLAGIYTERGEIEAAYRLYTYILEKEPRFKWVRDDLLPALLQ